MTDAEIALERLTAWVRDFGDKKPKEFSGDICLLLILAKSTMTSSKELRSQSAKCQNVKAAAVMQSIAGWLDGHPITDDNKELWEIIDGWAGE